MMQTPLVSHIIELLEASFIGASAIVISTLMLKGLDGLKTGMSYLVQLPDFLELMNLIRLVLQLLVFVLMLIVFLLMLTSDLALH